MTAAITDADRLLERVATAIRDSVAEDAYVSDPDDLHTVVDGLVDFCEVARSVITVVLEEAAAYLDRKAEWLAEDGMAGTYRGAIEDLRRDAAAIRALTTDGGV